MEDFKRGIGIIKTKQNSCLGERENENERDGKEKSNQFIK